MIFHPIVEEDIKSVVSLLSEDLKRLEGKNILITGASGMLMRYIVYTVLYANVHMFKKKATLYLIIRNRKKAFGNDKNIRYLRLDISLKKPKVHNMHFIIHGASNSAPKHYTKQIIDTLNTNIKGMYNVLDIVNRQTESILFLSSVEIYGEPKGRDPIKEDYLGLTDHLNKRASYVEGKRAGETIAMSYFLEKKYPIKIARVSHSFGPGLNLNDGRVFSDFIKSGLAGEDIQINGDKNAERPLLYIKDATVMLLKILIKGSNGQVYNVSNDKNVTSVLNMAKIVCDIFNNDYDLDLKIKIKKQDNLYYKNAVKRIVLDISKFKESFNFTPPTDIRSCFKRTIDYYKKMT